MSQAEAAATTPVTESVIHAAGKFYQAVNAKGIYFFGPQDKAELFAKGEYSPEYAQVVDNGKLLLS
ncbi:MAG: hypothetical protein ACKO0Z_07075 [Betaproteobacteria bacterium]